MGTGLKKEDSAALKGLAILLMIWHHCYYKIAKFGRYDVIFRGITQEQMIRIALCFKICVAIFAFVSGYGLMYGYSKNTSRKDSKAVSGWTVGHLVSTGSGYWFVAVLSYLVYAVLKGGNFAKWGETKGEKLFAIFADILGIGKLTGTKSLNGAWWYMSAALVFILLVPVLYTLLEKWGAVVCTGLIFLFPRITGIGFPGGTSLVSFLMIFVVGMICCKYDFFTWFHRLGNEKKVLRIGKAVLLFLCLAAAFWMYHKLKMKVIWEYQYAFVPFLTIVFCVEYLFRIPWISKIFQFLGRHSMNIWLVHTFVRDYMGKLVFSVKEFWLIPFVILLISLAASYVIEFLKKVTGYKKLTQHIQQKLR